MDGISRGNPPWGSPPHRHHNRPWELQLIFLVGTSARCPVGRGLAGIREGLQDAGAAERKPEGHQKFDW